MDESSDSQWYYGFKCGSSILSGVFPASCTEEPADGEFSMLYAEIMSFLPMAQQMFMVGFLHCVILKVGDRWVFQKATVYLQEIAGCGAKIWHSLSQSESKRHKIEALEFLSFCERYFSLNDLSLDTLDFRFNCGCQIHWTTLVLNSMQNICRLKRN